MIQETLKCAKCGSTNIRKNGRNKAGNPQYHCKDCGAYRTINPKVKYTEEQKEIILKAYKERPSMRGIQRIFKVSTPTLSKWLKKSPDDAGN
jgi:transposase-like protein